MPKNSKIGYISNSRDWLGANAKSKQNAMFEEMAFFDNNGFQCEHLDLKNYFGKKAELRLKLENLDGIWVCGGNTFVLRLAMKISGFDLIFKELLERKHFFYGGYRAGICVLCDSLKYIEHVDDPYQFANDEIKTPIYDGLGVVQFAFLPHYQSDHEESELIHKEVERCMENNWKFKTLKDGEVLIFENVETLQKLSLS